MTKVEKLTLWWWGIATVLLGGLFFAFHGDNSEIASKLMLTLGGSSLVLGLLLFESKVHLSLILVFISELCYITTRVSESSITIESLIAMVGLFSGIYIVIRKLRKEGNKVTISNIAKQRIKPFNTILIVKVIALSMMITVVFSSAQSVRIEYGNAAWISVLYMSLPVFILLLSMIPVKEVIYLRVIYYMMWIMLIQMANDIGNASIISMTEPVIYLITMVVGRIYSLGIEAERKSLEEFRKNI